MPKNCYFSGSHNNPLPGYQVHMSSKQVPEHTSKSASELTAKQKELLLLSIDRFIKKGKLPAAQRQTYLDKLSQRLCKQTEGLSKMPNTRAIVAFTDLCQRHCNDFEDILLLQSLQPKLIEKYRYQTLTIIHKYVREGQLQQADVPFVLEDICGRLTEKLVNGALQGFKEGVLFRTYFYRITENAVIDELRKRSVRIQAGELQPEVYNVAQATAGNPAQHNVDAFGNLLALLFTTADRHRFELCLKVIYRMVLVRNDIATPYPQAPTLLVEQVMAHFGQPYHHMPKGDLWELLNQYASQLDGRLQSVRTLKDWVQANQYHMLEVLIKKPVKPVGAEQKNAVDHYFELLVYSHYER